MKTLTNDECSAWLACRKLAPDPYHSPASRPPHYEQFPLSPHALRSAAVFRSIVACVEPFEAALLHLTDWSLYNPDEMAVVAHIRQASGEHRPLIETPGHVFSATDRDLLIGLLALVTSYGWTAYLYFDHGMTLLSWEGELLDLYSSDSSRHDAVLKQLQHMGVSTNATGHAL